MKRLDLYNYAARVIRIIDGDTLVADIDIGFTTWKLNQHIRLYGINAPELKGSTKAAGEESKQFLTATLKPDSMIYMKSLGFDVFGRVLATIYLPDQERSINDIMIDKKLAVAFKP